MQPLRTCCGLAVSHNDSFILVGKHRQQHAYLGPVQTVVGEDHSEEGRHFSYFAFEGSKGELRWKHEVRCRAWGPFMAPFLGVHAEVLCCPENHRGALPGGDGSCGGSGSSVRIP